MIGGGKAGGVDIWHGRSDGLKRDKRRNKYPESHLISTWVYVCSFLMCPRLCLCMFPLILACTFYSLVHRSAFPLLISFFFFHFLSFPQRTTRPIHADRYTPHTRESVEVCMLSQAGAYAHIWIWRIQVPGMLWVFSFPEQGEYFPLKSLIYNCCAVFPVGVIALLLALFSKQFTALKILFGWLHETVVESVWCLEMELK